MGATCTLYRVNRAELALVLEWERAERYAVPASAPNPLKEERFSKGGRLIGSPEGMSASADAPLTLEMRRQQRAFAYVLSREYREDPRIGHTRRPCTPLGRAVFGAESDPYTPPAESILSLNRPGDVRGVAHALRGLDPEVHASELFAWARAEDLPTHALAIQPSFALMATNLTTFYSAAEESGEAVVIFAT